MHLASVMHGLYWGMDDYPDLESNGNCSVIVVIPVQKLPPKKVWDVCSGVDVVLGFYDSVRLCCRSVQGCILASCLCLCMGECLFVQLNQGYLRMYETMKEKDFDGSGFVSHLGIPMLLLLLPFNSDKPTSL